MSKNNNHKKVFNKQTLIHTTTKVPQAGGDNHANIHGSHAAWKKINDTSFIDDLSAGQEQRVTSSADQVVKIQKNQIVTIEEAQATTAKQKITITSAENEIHVIAATQITLEVGESKIIMTRDGKIRIAGKEIEVVADVRNTIIGKERVDINPLDNELAGASEDNFQISLESSQLKDHSTVLSTAVDAMKK